LTATSDLAKQGLCPVRQLGPVAADEPAQQSTMDNTNEIKQDTTTARVKSWTIDSVHPSYSAACARIDQLEGNSDILESKIHKQKRGFVVKIWTGKMKDAPKPKVSTKNDPAPNWN
jgi:hypothetical protein